MMIIPDSTLNFSRLKQIMKIIQSHVDIQLNRLPWNDNVVECRLMVRGVCPFIPEHVIARQNTQWLRQTLKSKTAPNFFKS